MRTPIPFETDVASISAFDLASVRDENRLDFGFDLLLALFAGDGNFFDDERPRRVQHASLAEAQLLVGLEPIEIAKNLRDIVDEPVLILSMKPR